LTAARDPSVFGRHLSAEEAAVFETSVVPRYLAMFGERLVEMIAASPDARVCHLGCRTGYPDAALLERLPNAHVHGCDVSEPAIELARAKAVALVRGQTGVVFDYRVCNSLPLAFDGGVFSHVFSVHPLVASTNRATLFKELARLVAPHGQALVALPLRGSFMEITDLIREYALKYELVDLGAAVEEATQLRPTDDMLKYELETAGFEFVEVEVRTRTLRFSGGRDFFDDPITRLLLLPEIRATIPFGAYGQAVEPFAYARDAIDKYWSDGTFELGVAVGVVSGRRRG
jgi:SAM-dependent methyltransferase